MIKENDILWLYRTRMFNNCPELISHINCLYRKKSLLYMHNSFFSIMYEPRQYCCYKVKRG